MGVYELENKRGTIRDREGTSVGDDQVQKQKQEKV